MLPWKSQLSHFVAYLKPWKPKNIKSDEKFIRTHAGVYMSVMLVTKPCHSTPTKNPTHIFIIPSGIIIFSILLESWPYYCPKKTPSTVKRHPQAGAHRRKDPAIAHRPRIRPVYLSYPQISSYAQINRKAFRITEQNKLHHESLIIYFVVKGRGPVGDS